MKTYKKHTAVRSEQVALNLKTIEANKYFVYPFIIKGLNMYTIPQTDSKNSSKMERLKWSLVPTAIRLYNKCV